MVQNSTAESVDRCHCPCELVTVSTNIVGEENESYMPTWFNENCTHSTTEAALNNLLWKLRYLKQYTTDILPQTEHEHVPNLKKNCLPSWTNVTNTTNTHMDRRNIYERILKDLSRMATFIYRLSLNNEPDSSPNRSMHNVQKKFHKEYHFIDNILHQCQCHLRMLLQDPIILDTAQNLARVNWKQCHWGCKDFRCLYREIAIVSHLNLIASASLELINN